MTFDEYFELTGEPKSVFGERCMISRSALYKYINGQRTPTLEIALRMQEATGGRLDLYTLLTEPHRGPLRPQDLSSLDFDRKLAREEENERKKALGSLF